MFPNIPDPLKLSILSGVVMSNGTYTNEESDYIDDEDDAYYIENSEDGETLAQPVGLLSSPARVIMLVSSVLLLFVLTGTIAWLLGSQRAGVHAPTQPAQAATNNAITEALRIGSLAPDFTLMDSNTGKQVQLSSLRGKPVWINFWATWCEACRVEMPDMKKAYDDYKGKGLVILGVDNMESSTDVNNFTREGGFDWTFLLDADGIALDKYQVTAIPTHWFVGKDGIIKATRVGAVPEGDIKPLLDGIVQ